MRSDAKLLAAARDDPEAFRVLYDRYATRVHGYFANRTRDGDAAMDLTAETFAQAWFVRKRFEDRAKGSAGPWLFGIVLSPGAAVPSSPRGTAGETRRPIG